MLIPIIIPTGYQYSCVVSGSTFKIVQCEHCQYIYVYRMTRSAAGTASDNSDAPDHAEAYATAYLRQKLRDDCDAVPCLECGKYQQHMIDALKRDFRLGEWYTAIVLFLFAVILGALTGILASGPAHTAWVPAACAIFCALTGGFLLAWRGHQLKRYEPNSTDLADRMKLAVRYARSLDDFRSYLEQFDAELNLPPNPVQ